MNILNKKGTIKSILVVVIMSALIGCTKPQPTQEPETQDTILKERKQYTYEIETMYCYDLKNINDIRGAIEILKRKLLLIGITLICTFIHI